MQRALTPVQSRRTSSPKSFLPEQRPLTRPRASDSLLELRHALGNRGMQSILGSGRSSPQSSEARCSCGGSCSRCSERESHAFEGRVLANLPSLTTALMAAAESRAFQPGEEEEERPLFWRDAAFRSNRDSDSDGHEHQGAAGIECDGAGGFRIDMGGWASAKCGIADCVRGHEQVHIDYRRSHGHADDCKKADGTPVAAGVKPPSLSASELKESECQAYTNELECESNLLRGASKECKPEIQSMIDDPDVGTKKMKGQFCGGGC